MFQSRTVRRAFFSICTIVIATLLILMSQSRRALARQGDPAAQREDLTAFERDFFDVDRAYSPAARTEAVRRIAALRREVGSISDARFALTLAQIVALADNGHTAMFTLGTMPESAKVGIRFTPFGEDFYIVRAENAHADLLGGRLVAIDGVPLARLRDSARTLRGGISSWRDRGASVLFESPGLLNAMGVIRSKTDAIYRLQLRDGTMRDAKLVTGATGSGDSPHGLVVALSPGDDGSGMKTLLSPERAPWALQDFSQPFRRRDAPELDAIVVQLHMNIDAGSQSIAKYLEASEAARVAAHRRNVVLDMRFNGGGNLQLTREFLMSWPHQLAPDGRIVVLTSPWTFSAAISSTAYLKQAGGDHVVLVGEAPGDRLQFFAEGQPIMLPHLGAMVLMATQRHDYLTGCKPFTDCHRAVVQYPIAVKTLVPEIPAAWTLEAYANGRDPGMEAAAGVLKRK